MLSAYMFSNESVQNYLTETRSDSFVVKNTLVNKKNSILVIFLRCSKHSILKDPQIHRTVKQLLAQ